MKIFQFQNGKNTRFVYQESRDKDPIVRSSEELRQGTLDMLDDLKTLVEKKPEEAKKKGWKEIINNDNKKKYKNKKTKEVFVLRNDDGDEEFELGKYKDKNGKTKIKYYRQATENAGESVNLKKIKNEKESEYDVNVKKVKYEENSDLAKVVFDNKGKREVSKYKNGKKIEGNGNTDPKAIANPINNITTEFETKENAFEQLDSIKYTVQSGDTLSNIATLCTNIESGKKLSTESLYQANKEVIGKNKHKIRPGQELKIPTGYKLDEDALDLERKKNLDTWKTWRTEMQKYKEAGGTELDATNTNGDITIEQINKATVALETPAVVENLTDAEKAAIKTAATEAVTKLATDFVTVDATNVDAAKAALVNAKALAKKSDDLHSEAVDKIPTTNMDNLDAKIRKVIVAPRTPEVVPDEQEAATAKTMAKAAITKLAEYTRLGTSNINLAKADLVKAIDLAAASDKLNPADLIDRTSITALETKIKEFEATLTEAEKATQAKTVATENIATLNTNYGTVTIDATNLDAAKLALRGAIDLADASDKLNPNDLVNRKGIKELQAKIDAATALLSNSENTKYDISNMSDQVKGWVDFIDDGNLKKPSEVTYDYELPPINPGLTNEDIHYLSSLSHVQLQTDSNDLNYLLPLKGNLTYISASKATVIPAELKKLTGIHAPKASFSLSDFPNLITINDNDLPPVGDPSRDTIKIVNGEIVKEGEVETETLPYDIAKMSDQVKTFDGFLDEDGNLLNPENVRNSSWDDWLWINVALTDEDIKYLGKLPRLDIECDGISDISFLSPFTNLTELSAENATEIPKELVNLTSLSANSATEIPKELVNLALLYTSKATFNLSDFPNLVILNGVKLPEDETERANTFIENGALITLFPGEEREMTDDEKARLVVINARFPKIEEEITQLGIDIKDAKGIIAGFEKGNNPDAAVLKKIQKAIFDAMANNDDHFDFNGITNKAENKSREKFINYVTSQCISMGVRPITSAEMVTLYEAVKDDPNNAKENNINYGTDGNQSVETLVDKWIANHMIKELDKAKNDLKAAEESLKNRKSEKPILMKEKILLGNHFLTIKNFVGPNNNGTFVLSNDIGGHNYNNTFHQMGGGSKNLFAKEGGRSGLTDFKEASILFADWNPDTKTLNVYLRPYVKSILNDKANVGKVDEVITKILATESLKEGNVFTAEQTNEVIDHFSPKEEDIGLSTGQSINFISTWDRVQLYLTLQAQGPERFLETQGEELFARAKTQFERMEAEYGPVKMISIIDHLVNTVIQEIDWNAVVVDGTENRAGWEVFENEEYEKNWSQFQKFCYRREQQIPGFKEWFPAKLNEYKAELQARITE